MYTPAAEGKISIKRDPKKEQTRTRGRQGCNFGRRAFTLDTGGANAEVKRIQRNNRGVRLLVENEFVVKWVRHRMEYRCHRGVRVQLPFQPPSTTPRGSDESTGRAVRGAHIFFCTAHVRDTRSLPNTNPRELFTLTRFIHGSVERG